MPASESIDTRQLTTDIVSAYARRNQLTADQLANVISAVYETLSRLGQPATEHAATLSPAVPIRRSVQRDHVVCLDCGWRGKMLRWHLKARHGLTVIEYRGRWELSPEHPLTAPDYSEQRSAFAKQVGLGRRRRDDDPAPVAPAETAGSSAYTDMLSTGDGEG